MRVKRRLYTTNVNIPVTVELKERLQAIAKQFGTNPSDLIRDMLENMLPREAVPQDFLETINAKKFLKSYPPIRTVIPWACSILGLWNDKFVVKNEEGKQEEIIPYPQYGRLVSIFLISELYQIYKRLT